MSPFKTNASIQASHRDLQRVSSGLLFLFYKEFIKFQQKINITRGVSGHEKWHLPEDISMDNHRPADWNLEMLPNTSANTHTHTYMRHSFDVLMLSCSDDNFIEEGGNLVQTFWLQARRRAQQKRTCCHPTTSLSLPPSLSEHSLPASTAALSLFWPAESAWAP